MSRNLKIVVGVLIFPLGIFWMLQLLGLNDKRWAIVVAAILSLMVVGGLSSLGGGDSGKTAGAESTSPSATTSETTTPSPAEPTTTEGSEPKPPPEPKANIYIVASKSFCVSTGIDDVYTGDGHVEFFYTFKNSGGKEGSVSVTPVRHYDDGQTNESPMDMAEITVAAHSTYKAHTDKFKYNAHEHEVTDCGVKIDSRDEVPIKAVNLG